jgi:hypothetical protein
MRILLWFILLVICWPLALVVLILYPILWLVLLPFRIVGFTLDAVFDLVRAILMLPARVLGGGRR